MKSDSIHSEYSMIIELIQFYCDSVVTFDQYLVLGSKVRWTSYIIQ